MQNVELDIAETNYITSAEGFVWKGGVGLIMEENSCAGARGKFGIARYMVGVQVCFDDVGDFETVRSGGVKVFFDIAFGINDDGGGRCARRRSGTRRSPVPR